MRRRSFLLSAICISLATTAQACIWDTDTLDTEVKGKLDIVTTVTGRFPRNPPRYYEMRLKRVTEEIKRTPEKLNLYDDAGAACDYLGRGPEAISWMERKAAAMKRFPATSEDRYRYEANLGTFLAHRWFRDKRPPQRIGEMKAARAHIAAALIINPNAHFGRERVQLDLLDWNLFRMAPAPPPDSHNAEIPPGCMEKFLSWRYHYRKEGRTSPELTKGLCGIVQLGGAWENADIFTALAESLPFEDNALQVFAGCRVKELNSAYLNFGNIYGANVDNVKANFARLRADADAWQKSRTDYMETRMVQGKHPDTDPTFWNDWQESPVPPIQISLGERLLVLFTTPNSPWQGFGTFLMLAIPVASIWGIVVLIRRLVHRKTK